MTLMPVTRIALSVDWSTNSGAAAWIGLRFSALTGPRSSIGSPITLTMRPSVCGPTGTEICAPVLRHRLAAGEALGGVHRDRAHGVLAEVLGDLEHELVAVVVGLKRGEDRRQLAFEGDVDDGADHLGDRTGGGLVENGGGGHVDCFLGCACAPGYLFLLTLGALSQTLANAAAKIVRRSPASDGVTGVGAAAGVSAGAGADLPLQPASRTIGAIRESCGTGQLGKSWLRALPRRQ